MTVRPEVDPLTAAAQAAASDPANSAWVSANAGSGKTFVLARRVIRLLLAGVDPSRILCLTFTRAASAEMAKRVFAELGRWTRLSEAELADAITGLNGVPPDPPLMARARRLFAGALDTPGGLKIQTIHAFCERLLQQFPFEANVAGHFEVPDERSQAALMVEARRAVLTRAAADPEGELGVALKTVVGLVSDFLHEASIAEFVAKRDALRAWIANAGSVEQALAEVHARLGVTETSDELRRRYVDEAGLKPDGARELVTRLRRGSVNDCDAADRLAAYLIAGDADAAAAAYLRFYLTEGGDFRVNLVTNQILAAWPGLQEIITAEIARLKDLRERVRAAELYESTGAMVRLANAAIEEYERRKRARGFLDFDDLIVKSVELLSRGEASRWVQYKLDRGIDHILIDEAQDTSPRQWQVIAALVDDFFAGEGASRASRSVFAVGDEKQSIFSFQGAAPAWFGRMQRELASRARSGGYSWQERELHLSFRSTPVILDAVDAVFAPEAVHSGLTAGSGAPAHSAQRRGDPGRVILWPIIKPAEPTRPTDWATPLDHLSDDSPEVQLAKRIAGTIRGWRDGGEVLDAASAEGKPRPIRAGEILILVRSRGALTDAINRQLKTEGVPIAGADRLALTEHIAVMDLCALARVSLTPEDDLSLAALLKSPLIGLDEQALFDLAHGRKGALWGALRQAAATRPDFAAALARIEDWRALSDLRGPHAFFARILAGAHGRRAFLSRLGPEALDVLDEFLGETLRYEESNTPSLEGFLDWLQTSATEIKRDSDSMRDEVRVLTVHGAKGLEADIVFLIDNGMAPTVGQHDPRLLPLDEGDDPERPGPFVWNRSIKAMPQDVGECIKQWRRKSEEEYRRLLYVGMTRARDRLYIAGIDKRTITPDPRWHAIVSRGLDEGCVDGTDDGGAYREWRPVSRSGATPVAIAAKAESVVLPSWAHEGVAAAPAILRLSPSTAAESQASGSVSAVRFHGSAEARERGRLVHRLLQSLPDVPAAERATIGARYLAAHAVADGDGLLRTVLAILDHGDFREVFAPGSRAEIEIAGAIETARGRATVSGRIDRLAVTATRVLVVDYKTNRPAPKSVAEVPRTYVAQLALYRHLLQRLYPERIVAAALLWTELPALMEVPVAALEAMEKAIIGGQVALP